MAKQPGEYKSKRILQRILVVQVPVQASELQLQYDVEKQLQFTTSEARCESVAFSLQ